MNLTQEQKTMLKHLLIELEAGFDRTAYVDVRWFSVGSNPEEVCRSLELHGLAETNGIGSWRVTTKGSKALRYGKFTPQEKLNEYLQAYLERQVDRYTGKVWGRAAIIKGWQAFYAGLKEQDCPYKDSRTLDGRVSFSRAYRKAWLQGYNAAKLLD